LIERGDVWWADLGVPTGSAPALRRPVLVVSADAWNSSRIATIICLVVTSNLRLAESPGNVLLDAGDGGLDRGSVVNVSQVITVDKRDLSERIGNLDPASMDLVEDGLRRVLAL
jgi:mRNA interferase MazF